MIKRYLQYIKENNSSYVHKELIEIPEFDQIIDEVLIDFLEDNNLICDMMSKQIFKYKNDRIEDSYSLDEEYIIDSDNYFCYGYHFSLKKDGNSFPIDRYKGNYIQNKLNNFYNRFKFLPLNKYGISYYYILGTPIKYSDKDILNYYNISGYKKDSEGFYVELSFEEIADMCLSDISNYYRKFFTSTEDIWEYYYDYDYEMDESYLNKENKEKFNLLKDKDTKSEIEVLVKDYQRDAQIEKNLDEIWRSFSFSLRNNEEIKAELIKGKYYPYIFSGEDGKGNSHFKIYFTNRLLYGAKIEEIKNNNLKDIIDNYFYNNGRNCRIDAYLSKYGDVNLIDLNKDISHILNKL